MAFKNERSNDILRNMIKTYVSENYDKKEIVEMLAIVIADYVASQDISEAIDLLAELDDSLEFLRGEGE